MSSEDLLSLGAIIRPVVCPESSILALWVTNSPSVLSFAVHQLLAGWGYRLVAVWAWLKVALDGRVVVPMDSGHKKPTEFLLLAYAGTQPWEGEVGWVAELSLDPTVLMDQLLARLISHGREDWSVQSHPSNELTSHPSASCVSGFSGVPDVMLIVSPPLRHSWKPCVSSLLAQRYRGASVDGLKAEDKQLVDGSFCRSLELFARFTIYQCLE